MRVWQNSMITYNRWDTQKWKIKYSTSLILVNEQVFFFFGLGGINLDELNEKLEKKKWDAFFLFIIVKVIPLPALFSFSYFPILVGFIFDGESYNCLQFATLIVGSSTNIIFEIINSHTICEV